LSHPKGITSVIVDLCGIAEEVVVGSCRLPGKYIARVHGRVCVVHVVSVISIIAEYVGGIGVGVIVEANWHTISVIAREGGVGCRVRVHIIGCATAV
jgi:hypothetical protein